MPVCFGQKHAEVGIREFDIDALVSNLSDGIIPPGDTLLLAQHAPDAPFERVLKKLPLALHGARIGRGPGVDDDRQERQAEHHQANGGHGGQPVELGLKLPAMRRFVVAMHI